MITPDTTFYHIYPLGLLGAPDRNDPSLPADGGLPEGGCRLDRLHGWIDHIAGMGFNAIYLGPVFESTSHGYDTVDYYRVDRRLGDNAALRRLVEAFHARGVRVVLDAVLNHVGRDFPAFQSVRREKAQSPQASWFADLDFSKDGPAGDGFAYQGWHGHFDLVKLNTDNPAARQHLLDAARFWIDEFGIDGLRLDAADCLEHGFLRDLSAACKAKRPDFWLMGEVVHGNYRDWANPQSLDSVTNYEAYKGLWSSLNDANYHEIDWTLKRQFGHGGMYQDLALYNFVDNHDVNRAASILTDPRHLPCLYGMLFAMPGIPSVYYGSEWGLPGQRLPHSDAPLRPALDISAMNAAEARGQSPQPQLCAWIHRLIQIRQANPSLRYGDYKPAHVSAQQFAFWRGLAHWQAGGTPAVLVCCNASEKAAKINLDLKDPGLQGKRLREITGSGQEFTVAHGHMAIEVPAFSVWFWRVEG